MNKEWKPKKGFNDNVSNEDYHDNRTHVSSSVLKTIYASLEDYKDQYIDGNFKLFANQEALDFGSYVHALILEPHLVKEEFHIYNSDRDGKWNDFRESGIAKDKIIITQSQDDMAKDLINNFNNKHVITKEGKEVSIASFFSEGIAEQTLCTSINGVKVKVRFDYLKEEEGQISDIKTTSSKVKTKKEAEKVCRTWGYDVSAALYVDAVSKVTGKKYDFYFCFLSKKDKGVTIFKASEQMLSTGRAKYKEAIKKLKEARKTGLYFDGITEIDSI